MFCPRCGTATGAEQKFCNSCGAPIGAASSTQAAATPAPPEAQPTAAPLPAPYQGTYQGAPQSAGTPAPPPGMVPMTYQAYPGGPQQVYYVPAHSARAGTASGLLANIREKIRNLASTDKLEGFSLKDLFKETFAKHGPEAVEEYLAVGSPGTTPPLEMVDTNWPKPWMFFRVLAGLVVAYAVIYALFLYTLNEKPMIAIMVLATFAVPVATLTLIWELNTPRNVSISEVIQIFVVGGGIAVVLITLWYLIPIFGNMPGVVEEISKLLAVIIVTYRVRGSRFPYQLNGILFGAAVGAGFACSETLGYGLDQFAQGIISFVSGGGLATLPNGSPLAAALMPAMKATVSALNMRGLLSPFGHIVWTAIAAGAFWRVKGDRTANLNMLLDKRFLRAFIIPVAMHTIWDASILIPTLSAPVLYCLWAATGLTSYYVLFGMVQQGLHQVRDMQKAQLEHTLVHVEATLGLGTKVPGVMEQQAPAGV
jgi:RsiW-degrading membrane proteinase PrsW (M82 family)